MRGERVFGAALIAAGLFALYPRVELPFGTLREPGAGFFPVVVAVALILFAALALIGAVTETDESKAPPGGLLRASVMAVTVALYAWLVPIAGFLLCTVTLLLVALRLGSVRWMPTLLFAATGAIGSYLLFTRLGVPLPSGLLGF